MLQQLFAWIYVVNCKFCKLRFGPDSHRGGKSLAYSVLTLALSSSPPSAVKNEADDTLNEWPVSFPSMHCRRTQKSYRRFRDSSPYQFWQGLSGFYLAYKFCPNYVSSPIHALPAPQRTLWVDSYWSSQILAGQGWRCVTTWKTGFLQFVVFSWRKKGKLD